MAEDAVLEILKVIQADIADLRRQTDQHTHLLTGLAATLNVQGGYMNALQQDVRMIRAAMNDMGADAGDIRRG